MVRQFNFYDIYGYFLPGLVILGLILVPIGIITGGWPPHDTSNALLFAALAYLTGHILQTIAINAVPARILRDGRGRPRYPSDRMMDKSSTEFSGEFKARLARQVLQRFGLDLHVDVDGDGTGEVYSDRNDAFFEARSFLIARNTALYVEQFEGMYVLMRGLVSAFVAGSFYLAGWALAFHRASPVLRISSEGLGLVGGAAALLLSVIALAPNATLMRRSVAVLAGSLLAAATAAGFWAGALEPEPFWKSAAPGSELMIWLAASLTLIVATRCYSSYRSFATLFAQSVWRDFSVCLAAEIRPITWTENAPVPVSPVPLSPVPGSAVPVSPVAVSPVSPVSLSEVR